MSACVCYVIQEFPLLEALLQTYLCGIYRATLMSFSVLRIWTFKAMFTQHYFSSTDGFTLGGQQPRWATGVTKYLTADGCVCKLPRN